MFEHFPYTDMHQLNLDWIIKIAKDFLDQYTQIQDTISRGLQDLDDKAQNLEQLLQEWYDTHSQDIANQLADALQDLNTWYTQHQGYLEQYLADSITAFNNAADQKAEQTIESIPADYTDLSNQVTDIDYLLSDSIIDNTIINNETLTRVSGAGSTTTNISTVLETINLSDHHINIGDNLRIISDALTTDYTQELTTQMLGIYFYTADQTIIGERHRYNFPVDTMLEVPETASYFNILTYCVAPNGGAGGHYFGATNVIITNGTSKYTLSSDVIVTKDSIIEAVEEINRESTYPEYYDTYISNKISEIRNKNLLCGKNGDAFIFLTDPHWKTNAKYSLALAKKIAEETDNKTFICGGDILNQLHTREEALSILWDFVTKETLYFDNNYRFIVGNHELNTMASSTPEEDKLTWDEVYSIGMVPIQNDVNIYGDSDIESFIYYWDNPQQKIRYIVLNGGTAIQYTGNYHPLDDIIRSTPNNYKIGVFGHGFFTAEDVLSTSGAYIAGMLNAVNGRTSYTFYGTTYDYSDFGNRNIEIMFLIGGHRHKDQYLRTANGVPVIGVTTDNYTQELGSLDRTQGTITEQAFDVINVDTDHRIIYLTRIGAGSDRQYTWNVTN